eukprot:365859-Chlamydomonas_euryale.AAC.4
MAATGIAPHSPGAPAPPPTLTPPQALPAAGGGGVVGGPSGGFGSQFPPDNPLSAGYKALVYLRCVFCGNAFPPGSGHLPPPLPDAPPSEEPRAQLLGSLLFWEVADLSREWGVPEAALADAGLWGPYPALQVWTWAGVRRDVGRHAGRDGEGMPGVRRVQATGEVWRCGGVGGCDGTAIAACVE